ncbi:serine hydrolase [Cesiribacter sp. SM1]|uniref:serine hydrolase n=1 Tax=Cesiribacter sp. SM1 TaxID=2861196 RepID=UPI001CD78143|nr:serine hydrolase [Cesiribacter sp. SM1]
MKNLKPVSYHLLLYLLLMTAAARAQTAKDIDAVLNKYLTIQHQRIGFNGVVLLARDSAIISQQAIGYASYEWSLPITADAKFKIASITKSFTGLLVGLAHQEGKLSLDDRLEQFFPELSQPQWKQISIRQLLSHTSGVPHWQGFRDYWTTASKLSLSTDQVLAEIFNMELLFEPGTQSAYSSPAYFLLASILEKVYQQDYATLIEQKITAKLSLESTGAFDPLHIIPGMTEGYHLLTDDSLIVSPYRDISAMKGGGNLYSSAGDMMRWIRSFHADKAWNEALVEHIFTPLSDKGIEQKNNSAYGMGWYIREKKGDQPKAYYCAGGTFGYSSLAVIYPEEQTYVVILANVSFLPMDEVLWKDIEKIAFNKVFELPAPFTKSLHLTANELEKFSGRYTAANGMELQIFLHMDKLYAKAGKNPPFEIYAKNQHEFFAKKMELSFAFQLNEQGKVTSLRTKGKGRTDEFRKQ